MLRVNKSGWGLLLLLLPLCAAGAGLSPSQHRAIDGYIQTADAARRAQVEAPLQEHLQRVEDTVLPLSVIMSRAITVLGDRGKDLGLFLEELRTDPHLVNPYVDEAWKKTTRKALDTLCCTIKNDPAQRRRILALFDQATGRSSAAKKNPAEADERRGRRRRRDSADGASGGRERLSSSRPRGGGGGGGRGNGGGGGGGRGSGGGGGGHRGQRGSR